MFRLTSVVRLGLLAMAAAIGSPAAPLQLPSQVLPAARAVFVYGQKIVYYDMGSGPPLVLLHGMSSSASLDWAQVMDPLSEKFRVIAPDQIGFGLSDKPTIDYSIQTWVDFLGEFLRQLKLQHVLLAGESLGGWIAADYAMEAAHPGSTLPGVDKLILSDAAGHASLFESALAPGRKADSFGYSRGPSTFKQFRAGLLSIFFDKSVASDAFLHEQYVLKLSWHDGDTAASMIASFAAHPTLLQSEAVDGRLGEIKAPTLVIWGNNDPLVPLADGEDFAKNIAHAKLVVVSNCGHAPPIEKAPEFLRAVSEFLASL